MSKGLRLPVGVNKAGGAAVVEGEANNRKILFTALGDCGNENAFQQGLGIPLDIIFGGNDAARHPLVTRQIRKIFDQFAVEKRFKLITESVTLDPDGPELNLGLKYIDIEADEERPFSKFLNPAATSESIG